MILRWLADLETPMTTTLSLNWNEVLIARMHQGELTCWTAWRRAIEAFTNPRLWDDPALWPQHFTEQPAGSGWGFEGYGLIAVDMDHQRLWSINDYAVPGDFHLPSDTLVVEDPHQHYAGLRALLAQPSLWPLARLQARRSRLTHVSQRDTAMTLVDVLKPGTSVDDAFAQLTQHRSLLKVKGRGDYMVFKGELQVPGWTVETDRGQEEPTFTVGVLQALHDLGWPAPDWASIEEQIGEFFNEMDEDGKDELDVTYERLKTGWPVDGRTEPSAPTRAPARKPRRP